MGCAKSFDFLILWLLFAPLFCLAERTTYIVHLEKSFMPNVFASYHQWHSSTIDSVKIVDPLTNNGHHSAPKLLYSYDNVFHGFSAVLSEDELEALKKSPAFISAYKDREVELHTTHTSDFLKLNPSSGLWPASKFGQDVIIGVIDGGVWPESASFRDDGMPEIPKKWKGICREGTEFNSSMCNKKLIGANYFNQGVLAANPGVNISMNSARDESGHGTHVASIAAGNYAKDVSYFGYAKGVARGVAPRARLAVYKVNWNEGSVTSDLIAGMDQAVADGVDIISISLGYRFIPLYEDSIAIASFGAMMKGVLVSASAGNRGPSIGTLSNSAPWILTVAAGTVDRTFAGTITLGNGLKMRGYSLFPLNALVKDSPVIYNKTISSCDSTELLSQIVDKNVVIVCESPEEVYYEGPDEFSSQMHYATEARFRSAIFISRDVRAYNSRTFSTPGVLISEKQGKQLINYVKKSTHPTVSISYLETYIDVKRAPKLVTWSARGPSRSYIGISKPDLMAPGVFILGASPPNTYVTGVGNIELQNDYTLRSGTSMACPHASGIAAMLKAVHPGWSPSAIRSAMMTTANPLDNTQNPIIEPDITKLGTRGVDPDLAVELVSPLGMGAGHVDPNRAVDPGLIYDATPQDYMNLLCSMNFTEAQFKTIARSSSVSYNCSNPSSDLNYPSFIVLYEYSLEGKYPWLVQKFKRTVTNVGSGAAKYKAKLEVPKNSTISVSPQVLVFGKKNEKKSYTLTIRYRGSARHNFGSITWVEESGNRTVRSPITVSSIVEVWSS